MEYVKLGNYCTITSSKRIFAHQYVAKGIPFYRSKEIIEKNNKEEISDPLFISEDVFKEISNKYGAPKEGDILLTSVGTLGIPYFVKNETFYFKDGNLTWLKDFSNRIFSRYIYYWLSSSFGKASLLQKAIGSSQPAITIEILKRYKIGLPEISIQRRIASILSTYDNLIDNNNKRIRLLEQMAENLYKEWFVRFRFPGHEKAEFENGLPMGWKVMKLDKILTVRYGKDHSKIEDGDIPILGSGGIMRFGNKELYASESVLIPRKGSLNNIMYIDEPFWTVDTMFFTEMKYKNIAKYVYYVLSGIDMESFNSGAALPSMTTNILNHFKVILPSEDVLALFDEKVELLFLQKKKLIQQNTLLSRQRDLLLPRLMSGKLEVKL